MKQYSNILQVIFATIILLLLHKSTFSQENDKKYSIKNKQIEQNMNLTTSQMEKIEIIKKDARQKSLEIIDNKKLSEEDKKIKIKLIKDDAILKRDEILTPSQKKMWDDEMKKRKGQ